MINYEYSHFANIAKSDIDSNLSELFLSLARDNARVESIQQTDSPVFFDVKSDELDGVFSMGKIAGSLMESEEDRAQRIAESIQPAIINLSEFSPLPRDYGTEDGRKFSTETIKKLHEHAQSLDPGSRRAQCYTIAMYGFEKDETVADRFLRDHATSFHARRQAQILVDIGRANETSRRENYFGTVIFEDGSEL